MVEKKLFFEGDSLKVIRNFPDSAMDVTGHELNEIQQGRNPSDSKPMKTIGPGAMELRVSVEEGAFRTIYVAKFEEGIYVLHAFQKKSRKTPQKEIEIAKERYKRVLKERESR